LITIYAAMHVILGFLFAAFLLLLLLPAYRRRIERFAIESLKRSLPLTEAEINADKDRIRAAFAIDIHKLEMKIEDASLAAARQSIELNRRDAKIHDLEQTIAAQQASVEEHENARRVLEQAILDRLPKVEGRLSEARKLLVQRDREIMLLTDTGAKQQLALDEATQINTQQRDELQRLKTTLETRAARNRETLGDPRFDGEVALRSEIEELRAKSREQANLIDRLQKAQALQNPPEGDDHAALDVARREVDRLKAALAKAEARISSYEDGSDAVRTELEAEVSMLQEAAREHAAEMSKMKAALKAFADSAMDPATGRAAPALTAKVEISQLQAEVEEQRSVIESLRAEISSSNERLVRQAQNFRDELRRLGGGTSAVDGHVSANKAGARPSLADRIAAPRVPAASPSSANEAGRDVRMSSGGFLKALNGGAMESSSSASLTTEDGPDSATPEAADSTPRRPRLLDRISGIDKQS
jgi:hypothetical protein